MTAEPLPGAANWGTTPYRYRIVRAKRGIALVVIGVPLPGSARFLLRRENAVDRLAKSLHLAREWQTQDAAFDERVYIQSDDERLHETLSVDTRLRQAVGALFQLPRTRSLELAEGVLRLRMRFDRSEHGAANDAAVAARVAAQVMPHLTAAQKRLVALAGHEGESRRDPQLFRYRLLVGAAALMAAGGLLALFARPGLSLPRALLHGEVTASAVRAGVITAVVGALVVFAALGRRSRTHRALAAVLLLAAPGVGVATLVYQERANIASAAPGQAFETRLVDKDRRRSKNRNSYYFRFADMPDARMSRSLRVAPGAYERFTEGQCLQLDIREGSRGDPVLADLRAVACRE